jgi:hypothetical protein
MVAVTHVRDHATGVDSAKQDSHQHEDIGQRSFAVELYESLRWSGNVRAGSPQIVRELDRHQLGLAVQSPWCLRLNNFAYNLIKIHRKLH